MESSISDVLRMPVIAPRPRTVPEQRAMQRRQARTRSDLPARGAERRATPRAPLSLSCDELHAGRATRRLTSDLSTFGLGIRQGPARPIGTRLRLRLYLPDGEAPLVLSSRVVGSYEDGDGVRVAFRNPSREAVRRIHRYLAARHRR